MTNQSITRIQRISKRFRVLFTALIFIIPVANLLFWLAFNRMPEEILAGLPVKADQDITPLFLALGFTISLIPVTVAIYGMLTLSRLFRLYENGIVFAHDNVSLIRKLGYVIIAWVAVRFIFTPLISPVITHGNEGLPTIAVTLTVSDLSALVTGTIVVLISWVMDEGRKLQDEQAHTV